MLACGHSYGQLESVGVGNKCLWFSNYLLLLFLAHMQALIDICLKVSKAVGTGKISVKSSVNATGRGQAVGWIPREKPFDAMNNIVANLLLNLTGYVVEPD